MVFFLDHTEVLALFASVTVIAF